MSKHERIVLVVAILASFVAFLDGSVVNVALPAIARDLGGGLATQQWVVDGYLLTLGALILIAGSLSDLFGRLRILVIGLAGFAIFSLLCAIAPNASFLIGGRVLLGMAGALLVPSSLALITSNVEKGHFSEAIGSWTAWTGIAFVVGPLLGGFMVDFLSWRLIFAINILPIAVTLYLIWHLIQQLRVTSDGKRVPVDFPGAMLCALGLGGTVFGLIEQPRLGWTNLAVELPLLIGVFILIGFILNEEKSKNPMLPLDLFKRGNFAWGNLATFFVYAGLSVVTFITVIFLQQVAGYSALMSGLSILPVTLIMFLLSPRVGALSDKLGPRWFMASGPVIAGLGFLYLVLTITATPSYLTQILPGIILFGIGLATTVTPLTAAILSDVDHTESGIASAVNNAVSRIAGLLAIAAIGAVVSAQSLSSLTSFRKSGIITAILIIVGGIISGIGIRNVKRT